MQTVERIIFLIIAIIVGVLLLQFIFSQFSNITQEDDSKGFASLEEDEFAQAVLDFWEECAMGEQEKSLTVYVKFKTAYTKERLFDDVKGIELCKTLQSEEWDCGKYEHVDFAGTFNSPNLVRLHCDDTTQKLEIT